MSEQINCMIAGTRKLSLVVFDEKTPELSHSGDVADVMDAMLKV